ncbi:hypothetical protein [Streptomyces sp. NPDC047108]|uniref:hypothetical protein n=1 Tax=Streptomyces sp. NPDC047108 TaxID=3155025 RepID=UPI003400FD93
MRNRTKEFEAAGGSHTDSPYGGTPRAWPGRAGLAGQARLQRRHQGVPSEQPGGPAWLGRIAAA